MFFFPPFKSIYNLERLPTILISYEHYKNLPEKETLLMTRFFFFFQICCLKRLASFPILWPFFRIYNMKEKTPYSFQIFL
jgi:hypothetical protein